MKEFKILLDRINKVKAFVNAVNASEYDLDLQSDRYTVDAKSIMGIFSLDLARPLTLLVHTDGDTEALTKAVSPFVVD